MIDPDVGQDTPHDQASDRTLLEFALILGFLSGAVAARDIIARHLPARGYAWAAAALIIVAAGLARPRIFRPVFSAAMMVTTPIRIVVSGLLLGIVYYGVFTPLALLFRLVGRDALTRRRQTGAATYWEPKMTPKELRSYFRQS
jgi:hypothetical protein